MENHHTNGNGTNGEQDPSLIQYESSLYKFKGNFIFLYFMACLQINLLILLQCLPYY